MRKADDCLIMEYFTGYMDACDDMAACQLGWLAIRFADILKGKAEEELGKLLDRMHEDYEKDVSSNEMKDREEEELTATEEKV